MYDKKTYIYIENDYLENVPQTTITIGMNTFNLQLPICRFLLCGIVMRGMFFVIILNSIFKIAKNIAVNLSKTKN